MANEFVNGKIRRHTRSKLAFHEEHCRGLFRKYAPKNVPELCRTFYQHRIGVALHLNDLDRHDGRVVLHRALVENPEFQKARVLDQRNEPAENIKDKDTFHRLDAVHYAAVGVTAPQGVFFNQTRW